MIANDGDEGDLDAALEHLGRRLLVLLDDDDERRRGAGRGVVGEIADAAGQQDADVGFVAGRVTQCGSRHGLAASGVNRRVAERHVEREHAGRGAKPPHVPIEQKRLAVVGPQRFVHALTVQKPVIEHRDDRMLLVDDTAVDVDCGSHGSGGYIRPPSRDKGGDGHLKKTRRESQAASR